MLTNYYRSGRTGIIQASDVPTLNQNTTGSAATLTTSRTFQTNLASTSTASFNGSANVTPGVTGTLPVANGGTGATTFTANQILKGNGTSSISNSNLFSSGTTLGLNTSTFPDFFPNNLHIQGTLSTGLVLSSTDGNSFFQFVTLGTPGSRGPIIHNNGFRFAKAYGRSTEGYKDIMILDTLLRVGINIGDDGDPTETLHVGGNARITGAYNVTTGSAANVFVTSDGVLQRSTSSIKYKSDVEDYTKGLNEVMKLRPVTYKSINSNSDKIYAGFIAEELSDLKLTELLENNYNGEPDAISYAYMVTLLTKAIQEQQEQITLLKKRLLILENK
jgi:hypothetical protein